MTNNILPISRRILSKTLGLDLVSVKPLPAPLGIIPIMDFKYGKTEEELRIEKIKERNIKITKIRKRIEKGKI